MISNLYILEKIKKITAEILPHLVCVVLLICKQCSSTQQRPVIITLTRLFNETSEALGGSRTNPGMKREIEDNSRKRGALFAKLNSGDISKNASEKLVQLCQSLDNGDFGTALQIQVQLTASDWDDQDSAKCEMN
ncbi:protein transport protein SEC31 homolog B-like isoform X2 [Rhododendron vialii]|uniref:protein transport protein SEC31 homolog B-like isoform X2 n=1 Tax=Rhododendron vialii TaxID=182163 RepID=UPI002660413B|nr:protein transport protein SEC31 homolog B-like isoform X2 [Rhododendron vialii]XP_058225864.1 protein transport protein SEC31 homolog B-like isoform X2 [Rhododendron vialii]